MSSRARDLRGRAVAAFAWAAASYFGGKFLVLIATLVLARLLVPSEFGVVAFATAVLFVLKYIADLGCGPALVYREDADRPEISSTAFWIGIMGALSLIALSWVGAGLLAQVGPSPRLTALFRVLSLDLLMTALGNVHEYRLRHSLQFKELVAPQVVNGVAKGLISVALALTGAGAWSLIFGQIGGSLAQSITLWILAPWRPQLILSRPALSSMSRFGLGIAARNALAQATKNLDYMIVGARIGSVALGYYYLAFRLPQLVILPLFQIANRVLFPYYARLKDDSSHASMEEIRSGYMETLRLASLVSFPAGAGIASLALPIVVVLYGEPWRPSAVPLALIAMWAGFAALVSMPGAVFAALGRSWLLLGTEILQLAILVPALWFAAGFGIEAVAAAQAIAKIVSFSVLNRLASRVIGMSWAAIMKPVLPALILSALMAITVFPLSRVLAPPLALILGVPAGVIVYVGLLRLFLEDDFKTLFRSLTGLAARGRRVSQGRAGSS